MSMVSDITDLFTTKLGTDLFDKTGQFIQGIAPIFRLAWPYMWFF